MPASIFEKGLELDAITMVPERRIKPAREPNQPVTHVSTFSTQL
jgi:hypothetical protein